MGGGCGPQTINLNSPSGIIHDHMIVLVRHKQALMCLQSNPKRYEQISMKILKYFFRLLQSLNNSLTHSLMHSVKHSGKLATVTALLLWWKCLEFHVEKIFHNIKCLHVYTVLLQFQL